MKVVKFGAVWCSGCLVMKPRWAEIEAENPWLETEMHDFDVDKEAVEQYGITDQLPVFVFLDKDSNEILRLQGEVEKAKLVELINEHKDK
ncbi:thioredoxin [Candidatus Saccharibacteria bacterium]|nr:thioredoxin [Candidatus Saccharibacteria bacterium]NCU40533.1 thioredoxin [Candidatus Saccharibacteria bacterium]